MDSIVVNLLEILGYISLVGVAGFIYKWRQDKKNQRIELLTAGLDTSVCDWEKDKELSNVFWGSKGDKPSPIFEFSFLNHFSKPVVLLKIEYKLKFFPLGLSGIPKPATEVVPAAKYVFTVEYGKEDYVFNLQRPLEVMPQRAASIQVELLLPNNEPLTKRYGLWFTLHFNDKKKIQVPAILLNSDNETGAQQITVLG